MHTVDLSRIAPRFQRSVSSLEEEPELESWESLELLARLESAFLETVVSTKPAYSVGQVEAYHLHLERIWEYVISHN